MLSRPSVKAALIGIAAVSLGAALNEGNGSLTPDALRSLHVTCAAILVALVWPSPSTRDARRPRMSTLLALLLACGLAYEFGLMATTPPLLYGRFRPGDGPLFLRAAGAAAVLSGGLAFATPRRARHALIAALVSLHCAIGLWTIWRSPEPHIDVYYFQRDSCAALLRGLNPYTLTFPNIYGDTTPFYGPGLSMNGRLQFGFVYPPLSLLMALPGHLLGDFRYSQLFAIEASAVLMALARDEPAGAAAAALFLLTPRSFFVLEQGWTEPYVVFLLAATLFAAHRIPRAVPYVLGLFLCVKQYLVFAIVPSLLLAPWSDARRLRAFALRAALTAAAVTVPLALWNAHAFSFDVVLLQLRQPLRMDALSYLTWLSSAHAGAVPVWIGFPVTAAVTALAMWRAPRTPAGFAEAIAAVFFVFFATSKQAFANYYFFVIGAMCCAIAAEPVSRSLGHQGASAR